MAPPVIRVGLIGHGTVGAAFATTLRARTEPIERALGVRLHLARVAVRRPAAHRGRLHGIVVVDDALHLAADPSLDVVVDASGAPQAAHWLQAALDRGGTAVTANTFAVARDPLLLAALARGESRLQIEASVAAAVPVVRALRDSLAGEEIRAIRGVLNAPSTALLAALEQGASFDEALARIRVAGAPEGAESAELNGDNAAAKLALLSTVAWRTPVPVDAIVRSGISADCAERSRDALARGTRLRLVAHATLDGNVQASVALEALSSGDPLATAGDGLNVVELRTTLAGVLRWSGAGTGGTRTASALLGDVLYAARRLAEQRPGRVAA